MDLFIARCAALLAGNGAVLLLLTQYAMGDIPIDARRGAGLLMAFPLIGLAAAYSALHMRSMSQIKRSGWFEWLSAFNFAGVTTLWVVLNMFAR